MVFLRHHKRHQRTFRTTTSALHLASLDSSCSTSSLLNCLQHTLKRQISWTHSMTRLFLRVTPHNISQDINSTVLLPNHLEHTANLCQICSLKPQLYISPMTDHTILLTAPVILTNLRPIQCINSLSQLITMHLMLNSLWWTNNASRIIISPLRTFIRDQCKTKSALARFSSLQTQASHLRKRASLLISNLGIEVIQTTDIQCKAIIKVLAISKLIMKTRTV